VRRSFREIDKWATTAKPGDRLTYFEGCLSRTPAAADLQRAVYAKACLGDLTLVQRKLGDSRYEYIAIKMRENDESPPAWYEQNVWNNEFRSEEQRRSDLLRTIRDALND